VEGEAMPLFEEKLVSPLAVRFSQTRIRPTFQNGYPVEQSLAQIEMAIPPTDSGYDVLLDAPFPPIEVIRWRPKLREDDGRAVEDDSGSAMLGEECWFTFDNRRLYCLQRAAMNQWPHSVAAVVRVMYDVPTIKSAVRKFRTTTLGRSVVISRRHDVVPQACWDWNQEVANRGYADLVFPGKSCTPGERILEDMRKSDRSELPDVPANVLRLRNDIGKPPILAQIRDAVKAEEQLRDGRIAGQALLAFVTQIQSPPIAPPKPKIYQI
jgi:hypothetical protein